VRAAARLACVSVWWCLCARGGCWVKGWVDGDGDALPVKLPDLT
jgi:hypothetical protein